MDVRGVHRAARGRCSIEGADVIGTMYTAAWGSYVVHRVSEAYAVLRDLGRASAFVIVALSRLSTDYVRQEPGSISRSDAISAPCIEPAMENQVVTAVKVEASGARPGPENREMDKSVKFRIPTPEEDMALGAWKPMRVRCMMPLVETKFWFPCLRLAEGLSIPHCYFITSNFDQATWYCRDCNPGRNIPRAESATPTEKTPDSPAIPVESTTNVREHISPKDDVASDGFRRPTAAEVEQLREARDARVAISWDDYQVELSERAAIIEYLGNTPRDQAERDARNQVGRMFKVAKAAAA